MLDALWRDLVHARRSLAKARAFTCICVVSLGIGMVPVIGVPYLGRVTRTAPPGVRTEGLVEVITERRAARAAANTWSYPDFVDLRVADTGVALSGWINGPVKTAVGDAGAM